MKYALGSQGIYLFEVVFDVIYFKKSTTAATTTIIMMILNNKKTYKNELKVVFS